jgi:DNA-binding MarR family transcriptional regulator
MSHHSTDLAHLLPLVRHAISHLGVEQIPTGKALGLTNGRMMALAVLESQGTCSMSEFARELGLPSPLATRVADELVTRGLVEREADAGDRRRVLLHLTSKGREGLARVHDEADELISEVLLRMTAAEAESLVLGLRALLRELHAPASDGVPPVVPDHQHFFSTERDR